MNNESESEFSFGNLGYRKHTEDKLAWKNEIQKRFDICIATFNSPMFFNNVERLIKSIIFDVKGYRYKTRIEDKRLELKRQMQSSKMYYQQYYPEIWYHPIHQVELKYDLNEQYYNCMTFYF